MLSSEIKSQGYIFGVTMTIKSQKTQNFGKSMKKRQP